MNEGSSEIVDKTDIGHEIGEHNIEVLGLDIHHPVFAISALLAIGIVLGTLLFQQQAAVFFGDLKTWITTKFDWLFMISVELIQKLKLNYKVKKMHGNQIENV